MSLVDTFGNFHPVLLHLPIGILVYAYLLLGFQMFYKKREKKVVDITFALTIGAITAVLSSFSGYLLSENGDYGGELLDWHKWLGIGTAIGSILLVLYYRKVQNKKTFFGAFSLFMILLTFTGHYGGSLTHGEGFLLSTTSENTIGSGFTEIDKASIFVDVVSPITKRKCQSCHNPRKRKGELLLNTLEGWKNGGKTGAFLEPGNPDKSLMLKRIHLPLSEKKHMPPSGKIQLEQEEIQFIEWWIESMKSYEDKVEDIDAPPHIMKFINARLEPMLIDAPLIEDIEIENLQKKGIPVARISIDKPWISVSYPKGSKIKKADIQKLKKFSKNVRRLELSASDLNDKSISQLNEFVNLKFLDISKNPVSSNGIKKLNSLLKLESLNLYGTDVDKDVLQVVSSFPELKRIYLWQTLVEESDFSSIEMPENLQINTGQNLEVFGEVQLLPPAFSNDKVIFQDSMLLSLTHVAQNASIYYTIDGSTPSESSDKFTKPIKLSNTLEVKAVAKMDGWDISEVISKSFFKSTVLPETCTVFPPPSDRYKADGSITLINAEKGSEQFSDGKWLGFSGEDVTISLDLGEEKEVQTISFGSLRDQGSYIFNPIGVSVLSSADGLVYNEVSNKLYPQITQPEDILIKDYIIDIPNTESRYLKIEITAQKKNPKWHTAPGADSWLFIDEVILD